MSVSCCKRKRSCYSGQSLEFRCARVSSQAEDGIRDWSVTGVQTYAVLCLRSEEHTSELQSLTNLVCRLLLEKQKHTTKTAYHSTTLKCESDPDEPNISNKMRVHGRMSSS